MNQLGEATLHVYEVAELALYIGSLLEADPTLQDVWLRGEIGSLSHSGAGHYYFVLKDGTSQLKSVLFRGSAARSRMLPAQGQAVVAHGQVRFYQAQGLCELIVDLLFPEGTGVAQMEFEALYRRLEAEGLFDAARKRPLPAFPRRIGVVSSDGGAVIHDIITVLQRRYPLGHLVFLPTPVQGAEAPAQIGAAIRGLCSWREPGSGEPLDLIVVARGGGSSEDLATFNDERLVRAIFASTVPVVSAVGHETDVTLADLVADLRAPTPSAAAEMITPDLERVAREIGQLRARALQHVREPFVSARHHTRFATETLYERLTHRLSVAREQVVARRLQLDALSPQATLRRGYALAEIEGRAVRSASDAAVGENLTVRLHRGTLDSTVTAVRPAAEL